MIKKDRIDNLFNKMHNNFIEMWEELTEYGDLQLDTTLIIKDFPKTKNHCFACEFVERMRKITGNAYLDCRYICPVMWIPPTVKSILNTRACEHPKSLYYKWCQTTNLERKERKELAKKIMKLNWTNKFINRIKMY